MINSRAEKPTHMGAYAQMFAPSTHKRAHYVSAFTHGLKNTKHATHVYTPICGPCSVDSVAAAVAAAAAHSW